MIALIGNHQLTAMAEAVRGNPVAYAAMTGFNAVTNTLDDVDLFSFRALTTPKFKKKGQDPDYPTYHQAMSGPYSKEWQEAMDQEIQTLLKLHTWDIIP